jgi:hypothetical protein
MCVENREMITSIRSIQEDGNWVYPANAVVTKTKFRRNNRRELLRDCLRQGRHLANSVRKSTDDHIRLHDS